MSELAQTTKNTKRLGYVARLALIERGHLAKGSGEVTAKAPPISKEDERELVWYFAEERRNAAESSGGSNFNAMLDRMALFTKVARACVACGGIREVTDDEGVVLVEEQGGTGFVTGSKAYREYMRVGQVAKIPHSSAAWIQRHALGDLVCKTCKGKGWIVGPRKKTGRPPDVRVTGQTPATAPSKTGGSDFMARLGPPGRKRAAMRALDPLAEAALESYYSPDGGDESALWHLTTAGQRMLEANHKGFPHQAFFRLMRQEQESRHDRHTGEMFSQANKQARKLVERMRTVWAQVNV